MLISAGIECFIYDKLKTALDMGEVPYYMIQDKKLYHRILHLKGVGSEISEYAVFMTILNDEIMWAIHNTSSISFEKLKKEHFKYSTESLLSRLPFDADIKKIIFNLDIINNIFNLDTVNNMIKEQNDSLV